MLKESTFYARIRAKVLKIPALKNSNKLILTKREEFICVCVRSPSLLVMKTKKKERIALKIDKDREERTL